VKINAYQVLVRRLEVRSLLRRSRHRGKNNIKMGLKIMRWASVDRISVGRWTSNGI
jgi:hypothetical protein